MGYLLTVLLAYLLGCCNPAYFYAKTRKVDLATSGAKNLGASNAALVLGWRTGILVGLHDIAKAAVAVILAQLVFSDLPYIGAVAGVSSVLGHIFPFYLKFRGGKGFAAFVGMSVALNWKLAIVLLAVYVLVVFLTDYMVMGTVMLVVSVPVCIGIVERSWIGAMILLLATVVILARHGENYRRMRKGTELSLRSVFLGKPKGKGQ